MSEIKVKTIEPSTGTNLTLGASGDTIAVSSDALKVDVWKDSGGNTLFQSDGAGTLSNVSGSLLAGPQLISTNDFTGQTTVSITTGIDSSYDQYKFQFTNVYCSTNAAKLTWNASIDGGSNYNVAKTTTLFYAYNDEADSSTSLSYQTSRDLAQGTGGQQIAPLIGNRADESAAGELHLFNPSSTTYVKHFYSKANTYEGSTPYSINTFAAGYANTTDNVDAVQFAMSSGNMDGKIKMWGVK